MPANAQLKSSIVDKEEIIGSLQADVLRLNEEVTKLQNMKEENEKLVIQVNEMKDTVNVTTNQLEKTQLEISKKEKEQEITLNNLTEKLGFEKDKALLEADKKHQENLTDASDNYNEKIRGLYESIEEMRRSNDNKVSRLENMLEESTSKHSRELAEQKDFYEDELEKLKEGQ